MSNWAELPDRREATSEGKVRLWFRLHSGGLRSCVVSRSMQNEDTIRRIGDALAAEGPNPRPRAYGDDDGRR